MKRIQLTEHNLSEVVEQAVETLSQGGVILYPTDTLYGLGVDALNLEALALVKQVKGRDEGKPLSVLVRDMAMAKEYGHVPPKAEIVAKELLPGPLTFVLKATTEVPYELNALGEIGVRMPHEAFCIELMNRYPHPVTATSANKSGEPTLGTVDDILSQLGEGVDLVIDAGPRHGGMGSTIISFTTSEPEILREGVVSAEALRRLFN